MASGVLATALLTVAVTGCQTGGAAVQAAAPTLAPVPSGAKVVWAGHYSSNIQPIFVEHCVGCHGPARADNGLRLDSYQGVMKGTQHGPVVVPGSPETSALVSVVKGTADPSIRMPHGGERLTDQEVQNIVLWIQAGAKDE
jgi:mono/diheme cytochrome c family protein